MSILDELAPDRRRILPGDLRRVPIGRAGLDPGAVRHVSFSYLNPLRGAGCCFCDESAVDVIDGCTVCADHKKECCDA
jgi:hypothetical protein